VSYIQNSLRPFLKRNPQPPIRTPRGNFRYSTWIAQGVQLAGGPRTSPENIVPATVSGGQLLNLFLFGSDNIARAHLIYANPANEQQTAISRIVTLEGYVSTLLHIEPETQAAPYESVYARVADVTGVRGIMAASQSTFPAPAPPVQFSVDATFDSGVIAGIPPYRSTVGVTRNPVILRAEDFSQAIVNAGYTITAQNGDVGVVVGVFEIISTAPRL
jgi:hypothetical protein